MHRTCYLLMLLTSRAARWRVADHGPI